MGVAKAYRYTVRWTEDDTEIIVRVLARSTTEALLRASLNKSAKAEGLYVTRMIEGRKV